MKQEIEEKKALEEERMKVAVFANNPELYRKIFTQSVEEEKDLDWITPRSPQETDQLVSMLESERVGELIASD